MTTKKLTSEGFQRAFHAARRLYWAAAKADNLERAAGYEESACRLSSAAYGAGFRSDAREHLLSAIVVHLDVWSAREGL